MGSWLDRLLGARPREDATTVARRDDAPPAAAPGAAASPAGATAPIAGSGRAALWRPEVDVPLWYAGLLLGDPPAPAGADAGPRAVAHDDALPLLSRIGIDAAPLPVPRMPAVVPQLLRSLREPGAGVQEVARQVAHDPVLVAAVLRRANSPLYRVGPPVPTLEAALLVLGHEQLRALVASVAFQPIINVQSGRYTRGAAPRVWAQSEACGAICRMLAQGRGVGAFECFLAALLCNVGTIVALRVLDEGAGAARAPHGAATRRALVDATRRLAGVIGRQWTFPEAVVAAAEGDMASAATPLAELLHLGETLARLRVLVDAGVVEAGDPRLALDADPALSRCFAAIRTAGD